jgi:hypothetical protein
MPVEGAVEAYKGAQKDVRELLEVLERGLTSHREHFQECRGGWGHVGDLNSVAERLSEIVDSFVPAKLRTKDVEQEAQSEGEDAGA